MEKCYQVSSLFPIIYDRLNSTGNKIGLKSWVLTAIKSGNNHIFYKTKTEHTANCFRGWKKTTENPEW